MPRSLATYAAHHASSTSGRLVTPSRSPRAPSSCSRRMSRWPGVPRGLDGHVHEQRVQVGLRGAPPRHGCRGVERERLDRLVGEGRDPAVEVEDLARATRPAVAHMSSFGSASSAQNAIGSGHGRPRQTPKYSASHAGEVLDDARAGWCPWGSSASAGHARGALRPSRAPPRAGPCRYCHAVAFASMPPPCHEAGTLDSSTGAACTGPVAPPLRVRREVEHGEHVARPHVVRRGGEVGEVPPADVGDGEHAPPRCAPAVSTSKAGTRTT